MSLWNLANADSTLQGEGKRHHGLMYVSDLETGRIPMRGQSSQPDQAVMRVGSVEIRYYVREPSPDRWNAVGIVIDPEDQPLYYTSNHHRMVVGVGKSRDEAIGDLISRVLSRQTVAASLNDSVGDSSGVYHP